MVKNTKNRGGYNGGGTIVPLGSNWFSYVPDTDGSWSNADRQKELDDAQAERESVDRLLDGPEQLELHPIAGKSVSLREKAMVRRSLRRPG